MLQSDIFDAEYLAMMDSSEFIGSVRGSAFDFCMTSISLPSMRYVFLTTRRDDARFGKDIDLLVLEGK